MALREYTMFRNQVHVFKDRKDAGRLLGEMLAKYQDAGALVLALPSGGVPVGIEVAKALNAALDLLIVQKDSDTGQPRSRIRRNIPGWHSDHQRRFSGNAFSQR